METALIYISSCVDEIDWRGEQSQFCLSFVNLNSMNDEKTILIDRGRTFGLLYRAMLSASEIVRDNMVAMFLKDDNAHDTEPRT